MGCGSEELGTREYQPKEKTFVVLELSNKFLKSFRYLEDIQEGKREIFFIKRIETSKIIGETMLLGQFVSEFESALNDTFPVVPDLTNRIYFPGDERILEYDYLKENEEKEVENHLNYLVEKHPNNGSLKELIQNVNDKNIEK